MKRIIIYYYYNTLKSVCLSQHSTFVLLLLLVSMRKSGEKKTQYNTSAGKTLKHVRIGFVKPFLSEMKTKCTAECQMEFIATQQSPHVNSFTGCDARSRIIYPNHWCVICYSARKEISSHSADAEPMRKLVECGPCNRVYYILFIRWMLSVRLFLFSQRFSLVLI